MSANKKQIAVVWFDAAYFKYDKPKGPTKETHVGYLEVENDNFLILAKPKKAIIKNKKVTLQEKRSRHNFLFVPKGMVGKILPFN